MLDVRPLEGIRVFELTIAIAGAATGRYLAYYGAEVIKVESRLNPDVSRRGSGWHAMNEHGIEVWMDSSPHVMENMWGKKSIGLNLKAPDGIEASRRLLSQCDIFLTNYSPPAIEALGLDYESVRKIRPDIIHIVLSAYGSTPDPYYSYLAYGPNQTPLAGLDDLTGWPDRSPSGISNNSYADFLNGSSGLFAVLAALDYRDRTGEGQCIDLSQFEGSISLLGPNLLDMERNGNVPSRMGNRSPWVAPHGVYPCRGKERWVAISVFNEDEWFALCAAVEHLEWADDPRFFTLQQRLANQDELDSLISEWTSRYTPVEIAESLQEVGVAAAPVMDIPGLVVDPHLAARDFWILAEDTRFGKELGTGQSIHLSDTPGHITRAKPCLGEDTLQLLRDVCDFSDAEIEGMIERRAVFPMARPEIKLQRPYRPWIGHFMPQLPW